MRITFDTPLQFVDLSAIPAAALASATYTLYLDTVNPPVKSYPVPAANVATAVADLDGSKRVVVDAVKDLGLALTVGTKYYVQTLDDVSGTDSDKTPVLTYTYNPKPNPPGNPSVA